MSRKIDDALFWIVVGVLLSTLAGCVESPTAPTKKEPLMILNPDLQGIA